MVQESTLRVGVDSRPGVRGLREFDGALDRTGRRARETESRFDRLQRQAGGLRAAFAAIGVGLVAREFTRLLDATTTIDNRLRLVTNTTGELNAVYDELLSISNETRTGLQANADLFNRLALSTRELGLTYREQLNLTRSLNQALVISGASAAEGGAGLIQLSQGLAAGALRGDELRSVLENLPKVADVIAQEFGVTRGELRQLGEDGVITADRVVAAFANAAESLDEEFGKITPTVESAFAVFNNAALDFVRNLNEASGIGGIFANVILFLAENFNILAGAAAGLAVIIGGVLLKSIVAMTAALLANPLGLIVVAAAAAGAALVAFGNTSVQVGGQTATVFQIIVAAAKTIGDGLVALWDIARETFTGMAEAGRGFFDRIVDWLGDFVGDWGISLDSIGNFIRTAINTYIGLFLGLGAAIRPAITEGIPAMFALAMGIAKNAVITGIQAIINAVVAGLGGIGDALGYIPGVADDLGDSIRSALNVDLSDMRADTDALRATVTAAGESIGTAFSDQQRDYVGMFGEAVGEAAAVVRDQFNTNLQETIEQGERSDEVNDLLANSFNSVATEAAGAGAAVDGAGGAAGRAAEANKELNETLQRQADLLQEITNPGAELQTRLNDLNVLFQNGQISAGTLNRELINTRLELMNLNTQIGEGGMAEGFLLELGRMTEGARNFQVETGAIFGQFFSSFSQGFADSIGQAIWDTDNLGESLKRVARQAISQLISSFIQLGIQMLANKVLGATLGASATAVSAAQAAGLASAWAPAAALASLATSGANSAGASAAISGTMALTKSLAAVGGAFADGGLVRAPGGPRSDLGLAAVSNGEYIVNAAATRKNIGMLEAMNEGRDVTPRAGGTVVMNISTPDADSFRSSDSQLKARMAMALERAERRNR